MHNQIYTCTRTNSSSAWSLVKYARMHLQVHCPHFHWYPGQFSRSVRKAALFTGKHLPGLGVSHQKHCTGGRQTDTHTHTFKEANHIHTRYMWLVYICMHTGCGNLTRLGPIQEQGVNTRWKGQLNAVNRLSPVHTHAANIFTRTITHLTIFNMHHNTSSSDSTLTANSLFTQSSHPFVILVQLSARGSARQSGVPVGYRGCHTRYRTLLEGAVRLTARFTLPYKE